MSTATATPEDLDDYWTAVAGDDEAAAVAVARRVRDRGVPVADVLERLVVTTQRRAGDLWWHHFWPVVREHAATAINEEVVHRLEADLVGRTDRARLLVACVEREWHSLPALVVAVSLRSWGHRVDYLGANASREQVVSLLLETGPRAVLLSASMSSALPRVRRMIEAVRSSGTPVVVGGRAFDAHGVRARRLGATAYAPGPRQARELLESLPLRVGPVPALRQRGAAEASDILARAEELERAAWAAASRALALGGVQDVRSPERWEAAVSAAVPHVVDCLAGSLLTEDTSVLDDIRFWLTEVVAARSGDPDAVPALWRSLAALLPDHPEASSLLRAD